MILGFGDPTKGMTRIWGHFVILVGCERVILRPRITLSTLKLCVTYSSVANKPSYLCICILPSRLILEFHHFFNIYVDDSIDQYYDKKCDIYG